MLKKYRIYCTDESKTVTGWLESEPTTCFNNNTHTIDTNQTAVVDMLTPSEFRLKQKYDAAADSDLYYLYTITATVAPFEEKDIPIEFDIDSNMFAVHINALQHNINDSFHTYLFKDTVIGAVIASCTDATELKVSQTVIDNAIPGFYLSVGNSDRYKIISKSVDTITIKGGVITASPGDLVKLTYFLVYGKKITQVGHEQLGASIIGSFRIPKGTNAGMIYNNIDSRQKTFTFDIETTFERPV